MPEHSTSFRQLSTLPPTRTGISYTAFPIDRVIQPAVGYGVLSVTPTANLVAFGDSGGPFNVDSIIYTLKNVGGAAMDWAATPDSAWVSVDVASGTLLPGESVNVTASIVAAQTAGLDVGSNETVVSFVNTTNGYGDADRSVFLSIVNSIVFQQFDGPFEFPDIPTDGYAEAPLFYRTESAEGGNAVKFVPVPDDPNLYSCDAPPAMGKTEFSMSGVVNYDVSTGVPTGSIEVTVTQDGLIPNTSGNYPAFSGWRSFSETTFDLALSAALNGGAFFLSKEYIEGRSGNSFFRYWTTDNNLVGYYVIHNSDAMYCDGYGLKAILSNIVTVEELGSVVARTGVAARTQTVESYTSGTRTYTGNKSRIRLRGNAAAGQTVVAINVKYLVTPSVGDPYYIYDSQEYATTPESPYDVYMEFPWIVDADVYAEEVEISQFQGVYDDFSSYTAGIDYKQLAAVSTWPEVGALGSPPPNSDAYDDFEEFELNGETVSPEVTSLSTGYGWAGAGVMSSKSLEDAYDDFEGYPTGERNLLSQGTGWSALGFTGTQYEYTAYDDMEDYSDGAISTLDGGTGWTSDGIIG